MNKNNVFFFQEIRLRKNFRLRLTDLLIKPIQRLTKYHMLLEAILKYSERAELTEEATAIKSAFRVMQTTPKAANEMMDVGRLQGFEVWKNVINVNGFKMLRSV